MLITTDCMELKTFHDGLELHNMAQKFVEHYWFLALKNYNNNNNNYHYYYYYYLSLRILPTTIPYHEPCFINHIPQF